MATQTIYVPDIGGAEDVDIIEVSVAVGDTVSEDDTLIVLETDKASMEIPAQAAGKVTKVLVQEGGKISEGGAIVEIEAEGEASSEGSAENEPEPEKPVTEEEAKEASPKPAPTKATVSEQDLVVPDIGDSADVDVIEVCVSVGDEVSEGDSLIVLETEKASMEIPAESAGKIISLSIKEGDKVSKGSVIGKIEGAGSGEPEADSAPTSEAPVKQSSTSESSTSEKTETQSAPAQTTDEPPTLSSGDVYAGPAVRKLARQMGVDLTEVKGSGPKGRITKDDVRGFVKTVMDARASGGGAVSGGSGIPAVPAVDFSKFGEIEMLKMSKIKKITATNMSRNWLNVPHVTQFDDVDISEMEAFRKGMKTEAEKAGVKLTPLPFLVKACAAALKAHPSFNVSMHSDGEHIVQKKYIHIGVAVATPAGLMVPVIRNADQKGLYELANECTALATKARDGKLMPSDMQGGCFTISSLGAIGGTGFTPIVNAPEVAILGVSRADTKPVWNGEEFEPRLMLPLSLSYDHRAINGADAGGFFTYLNLVLKDVRRLLL